MAPEGYDKFRLRRFGQRPQCLNTQILGVVVLDYRFAGMFVPAKFGLQTHEGVVAIGFFLRKTLTPSIEGNRNAAGSFMDPLFVLDVAFARSEDASGTEYG